MGGLVGAACGLTFCGGGGREDETWPGLCSTCTYCQSGSILIRRIKLSSFPLRFLELPDSWIEVLEIFSIPELITRLDICTSNVGITY